MSSVQARNASFSYPSSVLQNAPQNPTVSLNKPTYQQVLYVIIDYGEKRWWKRPPGPYIYEGIVVRFCTVPPRHMGPGQLLFKLEYGECITEIRFNQDENVLKAIQFVLSSGRASEIYRFDQTTPLTMRYATTPERGEIVGLIRSPSRVYRGAIILGFVHKFLLNDVHNSVGNAAFFLDLPNAWKNSFSAKCWFTLNVLCCTQTCNGDAVHNGFSKNCMCLINSKTGGQAVCCMLLGCITCLPRILITVPFCCFFDGCGICCLDGCGLHTGRIIPYCMVICCGMNDNDPNMYLWLPHTCDHRKLPGFYPGRIYGESNTGVIFNEPTSVGRSGVHIDVSGRYIVWGAPNQRRNHNGDSTTYTAAVPYDNNSAALGGGGDSGGWFEGGDNGGTGGDGGGFSGDGGGGGGDGGGGGGDNGGGGGDGGGGSGDGGGGGGGGDGGGGS